MNKIRIQRLIDHLRSPRRPGFGMESYLGYREESGTCLCLAGHAALLAMANLTDRPLEQLGRLGYDDLAISDIAEHYLGLSPWQATALFLPLPHSVLACSSMTDITVAAGVRVLEILLEDGLVRWSQAIADTGGARKRWVFLNRADGPEVRAAINLPSRLVHEIMGHMHAENDFEICHYLALQAGCDIEIPPPPVKIDQFEQLQLLLLDPKDPDLEESEEEADEESEDSDDEESDEAGEEIQEQRRPADLLL